MENLLQDEAAILLTEDLKVIASDTLTATGKGYGFKA
jgi:hypothetical protein